MDLLLLEVNPPNWADILSSVSTAVGVVGLIATLFFLWKSDRSQTKQLSVLIKTSKDQLRPEFVLSEGQKLDFLYEELLAGTPFRVSLKNIGSTAEKISIYTVTDELLLSYRGSGFSHGRKASHSIQMRGNCGPGGMLIFWFKLQPDATTDSLRGIAIEVIFHSSVGIAYHQYVSGVVHKDEKLKLIVDLPTER